MPSGSTAPPQPARTTPQSARQAVTAPAPKSKVSIASTSKTARSSATQLSTVTSAPTPHKPSAVQVKVVDYEPWSEEQVSSVFSVALTVSIALSVPVNR